MITVNAGGNLQAALDTAPVGETIALEAGATFPGNYTASRSDLQITGAAILRTQNSLPALRTIGNAARWRFADVTFAAGTSGGPIVQLGDGLINTEAGLPRDFTFDRCAFVADRTAKNGLEMNAAGVTLRHCTVRGVKMPATSGVETHALIAWNSPGPFTIEDCTIEAGSCGVFFGGAKPAIDGLIPSDITLRRSLITRPLAMRGAGFAVKNLLELKNAQRVIVTGNILEHNWPDSQAGWSIVFTVRANSPAAPWSTIQHVLFESNILRHASMGFNILGLDNQRPRPNEPEGPTNQTYPSQPMDDVVIRNNLFYDIDHTTWGGNGCWLNIGGAPRNLQVEGNTVAQTGNVVSVNGLSLPGFRFTRNIVRHNAYGIFGDAVGTGNPAIARYFPDGVITANVFGGGNFNIYPAGNTFMPSTEALLGQFTDPTTGNYRLWPVSPLAIAPEPGCDQDAIETAQQPPAPPPPPPPPPPTLAEIIDTVCTAAFNACADITGATSPQDAGRDTVERLRLALQLRLVP